MWANPSTAAEAAASEVLDLNADAAEVEDQEPSVPAVAEEAETKSVEEAVKETSVGPRAPLYRGLDGEEMGARDDREREINFLVAGSTVEGSPVDVLDPGGDVVKDQGVAVDISNRNDRTEEAEKNQSREKEAVGHGSSDGHVEEEAAKGHPSHGDEGQNRGEVAVEIIRGTEDKEEAPSLATTQGMEPDVVDGSTGPDGGSMLEGDWGGDQEAYSMNLDVPEGVVVPAVEEQNKIPQPVDEKPTDRGDVIAPDLNIVMGATVEGTLDVEVQNMNPQLVDEKPVDVGSVIETDLNSVTGTSVVEAESDDTHLVDETPVDKGDVVMGDSNLVEVGLPKSPQPSEDQSGGSHPPSSVGEHGAFQVKLSAGPLPDENQNVEAQREVIHLVDDNPMDNKHVVMFDSNSIAEASLPVTLQPSEVQNSGSQAQPSEVLFGSSQVEVSSGPSLVKNQNTQAQHMGSVPDKERDSQLNVLVGLDTSSIRGKNLATESEAVKTDVSLPEEHHGQKAKVVKKEVAEVISLPGDSMENEVTVADTDGDQKVEATAVELFKKAEKRKPTVKHTIIRPGTLVTENDQRACYYLPQEEKSVFSIYDLVWGKVRSHPWWPGQIYDPSDASEMALKHQRKDNFLVAYFGDKTFAWCEESQLKHFQTCFSQMENQSTSDAFVNAVNSALGEVSRRVVLGMLCLCASEQSFNNLKYQKIENAGIREGSSCSALDTSLGVTSFQPRLFLEYIQALAQIPCGGADRLELTIAKGQLMAFNFLKGYTDLPAFYVGGGLLENDAVVSPSERKRAHEALIEDPTLVSMDEEKMPTDLISGKRKQKAVGSVLCRQKYTLEDGRKQKSLSELMKDKNDSHIVNGGGSGSEMKVSGKSFQRSSGKKHKGFDSVSADSGKSKKKRLDALGDLETKSPSPTLNRSLKVGECIRRVARKLTGSSPIDKCNSGSSNKGVGKADLDDHIGCDASLHTLENTQRMKTRKSKDYSSPDEMLSQLCLAARDPMKGYSFLSTIINFFTDIRKSRVSSSAADKKPLEMIRRKRGRKKSSISKSDFLETSTPLEMIRRKRGRKKSSHSKTEFLEASTLDYMEDSYWTDRVVYSSSGGKLLSSGRKRKGECKMLSPRKKTKSTEEPSESLPLSKMLETAHHLRISSVSPTGNRDLEVEKQVNNLGEKCVEESTPAELILSFTESDALPSETDLIRIFSRYGLLKEAETEVLKKTNRAKVVFKRRADAEVAFSSAGKYSIFGPALVSYRLRYLPSTPKMSPHATPDGKKNTATTDGGNLEVPETKE